MQIHLAYGQGQLAVDLDGAEVDVIEPRHQPALPDERATVLAALDQPVAASPLRDWLKPGARICLVFTDLTRATPNHRLIPWLLDYLGDHGVQPDQVTLLNSTGTHRPNTPAELDQLLTPAVTRSYRVINHQCQSVADLVERGVTRTGAPALLNRHLVEADVRIVTGFIEPHFFAGFSGGPKGIMPGCAGLATVMANHGFRNLNDPLATFGVTDGNPLWEDLRDVALRVGPSFLTNVTLNDSRAITGVFAGDLIAAHRVGCEFVRASAMQPVAQPYDVVLTSNSGYPLDQNLYQAIKGVSAAARITRPGGTIILAAECREGVPAGSPYDHLLRQGVSPAALLALLANRPEPSPEQWQVQIQALIQQRARVLVHSAMPDETLRAAHLEPCRDIAATVREIVARAGGRLRIAALPQGPLTIPYLKG